MPKAKRTQKAKQGHTSQEASSDSDGSASGEHDRKKVRWNTNRATSTAEDHDAIDSDTDSEGATKSKTCLAAVCLQYVPRMEDGIFFITESSMCSGYLGCAYYDPAKRVISILEDTQETLHYDLTRMLLEQVSPDVVLTSSKADDKITNVFNEYAEQTHTIFQIRPFKEFVASKGRERLLSLSRFTEFQTEHCERESHSGNDSSSVTSHSRTGGVSRNAEAFMQSRLQQSGDPTLRRWNASIRIANFAAVESAPLCMASVGALLDFIVRERALADFDDEGLVGLDIKDIETLALDEFMQINADALTSLQIFEDESHASMHSDRTKEGLSLFGILNNTKTTLGRSLLRTWLMRPSLSLAVINSRHDAVECFTRSENISAVSLMQTHLKGIKNVPRMLSTLCSGKGRLRDWQGIVKFTFHTTMIRDGITDLYQASNVDIIRKLTESLDVSTFKEMGMKINDLIDWEESTNNDRVCVRQGIDEDLDNRKHVYHGIDSILSSVAQQISETVPPQYAASLNVVYFPQLGYLISVPMIDEWRNEDGVQPLPGWTFQFSSDAHVYFKSEKMQDLDTHIGDLHSTIIDRELEIVQELLDDLVAYEQDIHKACEVCAELDCVLSFAQASRQFGYNRPNMARENVIEITQGRHPLHELIVDTFVANDCRLMGSLGQHSSVESPLDDQRWNSIVLCTGANACGKSVYLKQVALIQIMAQIGCFVPAEFANLGITDKIFTRISTKESVSKAQSAFMIDLAQVSLALRNCTPRSLIILDEFGKGTLATDGAGLFCGVIRHLLNRGSACPKVLVATHFHDVFNEGLLDPEQVPISFYHMQVMFTTNTSETLDTHSFSGSISPSMASVSRHTLCSVAEPSVMNSKNKITYLYRVAEGLSLNSHAIHCAEMFGIPTRVVERAYHVSSLLSKHEIGRLLDEDMTAEQRQQLEDAEAVCRRFLAWDLSAEDAAYGAKDTLGEVLGITK